MSDTDPSAHDWAFSIQKRQEEEISGKIISSDDRPFNLISELHNRKVQDLLSSLGFDGELPSDDEIKKMKITPLDDPRVRKIYEPIFAEALDECCYVDENFSREDYKFYTMPSGEISAIIVSNTWDGKYNIFFDREVSIFNNMISKIVAFCYKKPLTEMKDKHYINNKVIEKLDFYDRSAIAVAKNDKTVKEVCENLFSRAVYTGYAGASRPWIPNIPKTVFLSGVLAGDMGKFVISHEIAHGLCSHLSSENLKTVNSGPFIEKDTYVMSHNDEYQADYHGLLIAIKSSVRKGYSPVRAVCAAYIFLKSIDILCDCYDIADVPIEGVLSSHPRAADRARKLKDAALKLYNKTKHKAIIERCLSGIDSIFIYLKDHAIKHINDEKNSGRVPRVKKTVSSVSLDRPSILGVIANRNVGRITSELEISLTEMRSNKLSSRDS